MPLRPLGYSRGTHSNGLSRFTQGALTGWSRGTRVALEGYSRGAREGARGIFKGLCSRRALDGPSGGTHGALKQGTFPILRPQATVRLSASPAPATNPHHIPRVVGSLPAVLRMGIRNRHYEICSMHHAPCTMHHAACNRRRSREGRGLFRRVPEHGDGGDPRGAVVRAGATQPGNIRRATWQHGNTQKCSKPHSLRRSSHAVRRTPPHRECRIHFTALDRVLRAWPVAGRVALPALREHRLQRVRVQELPDA